MRNVSLVPARDFGEPTWRLINGTGEEVGPFTIFQRALVKRGYTFQTRRIYSRRLGEFIDYLFEASVVLASPPTKAELLDLVHGYQAILRFGSQVSDDLAKTLCERLGFGGYSTSYENQVYAALDIFFRLSERQRRIDEIQTSSGKVDDEPMFEMERVPIKASSRSAMRASSMLAGCISGGPQMIDKKIFSRLTTDSDEEEWPAKAFPYDKVLDLIRAPRTYRDRTLYALLAASGCRISEGLQVCMNDIDPKAGVVRLINPANRPSGFYGSLTQEIIRKHLRWKGRKTSKTFLISPFAEEFWHNLQMYFEKEYYPGAGHPFLFQQTFHRSRGRPLALVHYSSVWEQFKKWATRIDCPDLGPHSLRHMYGIYLVNFAPNTDGGSGLKTTLVSVFMGHKKVATTEGYALPDKNLAAQELAFANAAIYEGPTGKSEKQLRIEIAEKNLARLTGFDEQHSNPAAQGLINE